ncbi:hypothetical protein FOT83_21960 [Klebsiella pneumoniae]|nr:hypothetical protein [Klebsiella pneumoniae]
MNDNRCKPGHRTDSPESKKDTSLFRFSYQPQGCRLNGAFSGIFDGWLAKVKSLVPIDDCYLIACVYHK